MNQPIETILAKFFAGEASEKEKNRVNQWKGANPKAFASFQQSYDADYFEQKAINFNKEQNRQKVLKSVTDQKHQSNRNTWLKFAASFIGLVLIGSALYFYAQSLNVSYVNNSMAIQHILLPDSSEVYLDKNASLQYSDNILGHFNRKVKITGRAFFHVYRDPAHPFSVNAGVVKVKVLGTRFTVNQMAAKTQVILTHGKVMVNSAKLLRGIILNKTGDQVIVRKSGLQKENNVKASLYSSWMKKKIYFDDCTVKEVVDMLNDSYNMTISIDNPELMSTKLFGSAPSDDPQLIIQALSQILHLNIKTK
jgi:transmembrane sensor